jgi:NodT family efflux transporter outer membrane factor (OMF) lipoprotein
MRAGPSVTLGLLALLSGCVSGPDYVRPTTALPSAYREAPRTAEGWNPAAPADAIERGEWWRLFSDLVLDDLERRVDVSNQNLAAAEAAYRQARALVREQRAAYFPTVVLDGSGQAQKSPTSGRLAGYQYDIGATWEPDVWGAIRRTVESGRANAQASAADLASAKLSLQGELAVNYLQLRETDAEIVLVTATVAAFARALQIAQNQYDARVAVRSDVFQAQTQLANAQATLASLALQRAQLEHAIAVLVGQPPGDFSLAVSPTWSQTAPEIPASVPSTLLERRPDIAAAERRVAAANAQIGIAKAAFFPVVTLSGSYGGEATQASRLFGADASLWSLGLSLAETVFDAGARRARTDAARAGRDEAVAQYRQAVLTAFQEVEDQLAAARILAERAQRLAEASRAADQAERISLNQYKAGQIVYSDVVVAQTAALSARQSLAQAIRDRQTTAVALIQALGGGFKASDLPRP